MKIHFYGGPRDGETDLFNLSASDHCIPCDGGHYAATGEKRRDRSYVWAWVSNQKFLDNMERLLKQIGGAK